MCIVLLPPGVNPIAVNKYININKILTAIQIKKSGLHGYNDVKIDGYRRFGGVCCLYIHINPRNRLGPT